ncbi:hypothetical protein, partial [uncultured Oscillibacter sp.]|uniref:hypothetical protein n=1 Tax=uncultured Oscillibacter sp. TaxID=876091 RepID=UPI0025F5E67E
PEGSGPQLGRAPQALRYVTIRGNFLLSVRKSRSYAQSHFAKYDPHQFLFPFSARTENSPELTLCFPPEVSALFS